MMVKFQIQALHKTFTYINQSSYVQLKKVKEKGHAKRPEIRQHVKNEKLAAMKQNANKNDNNKLSKMIPTKK